MNSVPASFKSLASETDLDVLMPPATAFRDHLGQSLPSDADFRQSLASRIFTSVFMVVTLQANGSLPNRLAPTWPNAGRQLLPEAGAQRTL
jgi:hypothetical protein